MCFAPQRRALFDIWTSKSGPTMVCFVHVDFEMCFATTACTFSTSQLPKVVRPWCALYILTWKCASRYNGVHFFDIATSKSGPALRCFVHFDLEMCFAPQRRALFRHRNFQKCSETQVLCTFWLGNVLRATTACTFSSLIWPAGSTPALRSPKSLEKHSVSRLSYLFHASASSFFLLFLFSLPLPGSAFHLSILSEVWLLNFLRTVAAALQHTSYTLLQSST